MEALSNACAVVAGASVVSGGLAIALLWFPGKRIIVRAAPEFQ